MYSGTTFRNHSGNLVGVHQRIDRVARRHLLKHVDSNSFFPAIKTILRFEGKNGPDGIKSKSPSYDEPWHFISPDAGVDDPLVKTIVSHIHNLAEALRVKDEVRAGFEAAWLSHAIVDGLTPAHHYPLADKIHELWGKPHHERSTTRDKIVIKSDSKRDMIAKNWEYWGSKGVFNQHWVFEWGVAASITVGRFGDIGITEKDLKRVADEGFPKLFIESLQEVASWHMYEEFCEKGWSVKLGNMSRKKLVPLISKSVLLAWYAASEEAVR